MSTVLDVPVLNDQDLDEIKIYEDTPFEIIVFNNETNSFKEVAEILQKALPCTIEQGYAFAKNIHDFGQSRVYTGSEKDCKEKAEIIRTIGVKVVVQEV
jgi:ATP-dependent Clp protease adapter protein ClpS